MKRSDAVKKIKSIIATRGPTQPTIDTAEQVLDMLEKEVGMLPPYSPANLDHGSIQDCQWTPEETICEIPEYAFKCNNCTCEDEVVSQQNLDELLEVESIDFQFLNKIVKLTAKNTSDDFSPDYPMTGRIVKLHKNGREALIVNQECLSSEDMMRSDGPFRRGSWFTLDKYQIEEVK